jgi:hypothetical protein
MNSHGTTLRLSLSQVVEAVAAALRALYQVRQIDNPNEEREQRPS